jgi:hypothetical protein
MEHCHQFSMVLLCQVMEVSVSGDYAWIKRGQSKYKKANQVILEKIKTVPKQSRQTGPDADIVCWSMVVPECM